MMVFGTPPCNSGGTISPVIFGERFPPSPTTHRLSHVPRCGPIGLRGEEGKGGMEARKDDGCP